MYGLKNTKFRQSLTGLALVAVAVAGYQLMEPRGAAASGALHGRSQHRYQVPDVELLNQAGQTVALRQLISDERPILVQFIFTSCQTVCPLLTATMAGAQEELRRIRPDTRILSISIDPEQDTPRRLAHYAEQFAARGDWVFLTGSRNQVHQVLRAFDALYAGGNKMNHKPYTFVRKAQSDTWLRLIGNLGSAQLVQEFRAFLAGESEDEA